MVYIVCDNDECGNFGAPMEYIDTDDRQEWCKETYECSACGSLRGGEKMIDALSFMFGFMVGFLLTLISLYLIEFRKVK